MAVNRKPIDYAADRQTAWNLAEMYTKMIRELGLNWAVGVDRTRANGRSIYEVYAVPKQREPQDDSP